ncbi:MAG: 3-isopropylmalate dehydrogenase [Fusobacteria bacterium]|nr:MAG: 3-isopropylmalate dehydrogenase [Fusobacteriota bacterium]
MDFKIAVLPGDGIGREIIEQGLEVLQKIGEKYSHKFELVEGDIGGIAIDKYDNPLPQETIDMCKSSDAVLLGAVGGPKWDNVAGNKRPEAGLLKIRKELELYTNIRPATVYNTLKDASPLKESIIGDGLDICVIRELTGGIYFGEKEKGEDYSSDKMIYHEDEVRRIAIQAFEIARQRNKKVTNVDKANVLETSRLWRKVVLEVAKDYPDVQLEHLYVDNAAMQLVINPRQFDVIVTGNLFGDILSDEASMITGSIGMLPSASIGGKIGLYEPIHGSAPDIANQDKANPIATILSIAMMLKYSFKLNEEANDIEKAVEKFLEDGYRTLDIARGSGKVVGTKEAGRIICENIIK